MIRIVPAFGPEIPRKALSVVENLERDLNNCVTDDFTSFQKFGTLVLNLTAVNPKRGVIPNRVKLMRSSRELWCTWNISFDDFVGASSDAMREQLKRGVIEALRTVDDKYVSSAVIATMVNDIEAVS